MKTKYLVAMVISLIVISFTVISIVEKRQPSQVVIQDIWVIDQDQSDEWLEFLKNTGGSIQVDDTTVYMYVDRNKFVSKMKQLNQQYRNDTY